MSTGQDVKFSEERLAQGQQLTNKLWNAARLILLGVGPDARAKATPTCTEDHWILSRLQRAKSEVSERIDRYDFSHAAFALYEFVYGELCDWYLELVKPRLRAHEPELAATLLHVLTETVALAHPLIPFETEEIYSHIPGADGLLAARVVDQPGSVDERSEKRIADVIGAVQALRTWRDVAGVKAGAIMPAKLLAAGYDDTADHVARLARLKLDSARNGAQIVATVAIPGGTVEVLASEELDLDGAQRKLEQRRSKLQDEIDRAQRKLANEGFTAKAPANVVEAEREKLQRLRGELEAL
jgi:valyl-tRNA synthetase